MALELDHLNKARREIEQGIQVEAERIIAGIELDNSQLPNAIALFQADWHQGVIGIVAGRIKEKFHRPSIVFAKANEDEVAEISCEIKGSARSIPGLHIRDLLEHIDSQNPGIINKFGGHAMAAGLSISLDNFERFCQLFDQYVGEWLAEEDFQGKVLSDGVLPSEEMTIAFTEQIRAAGPWGQSFTEPVFDDEFTLLQQRIVGEKHLKMVVGKDGKVFDAIAFNVDTKAWPNALCQKVHLAYKLDINEFRGNTNLQLMVEHLIAC